MGCLCCGAGTEVGSLCRACAHDISPCEGLIPEHIRSRIDTTEAAAWLVDSVMPQLIETTVTPGCVRAVSTAAIMLWVLVDRASTTTIVAAGAIACAHSTSMASSCAQPLSVRPPARLIWLSGGSGRLNVRSNVRRSEARYGS